MAIVKIDAGLESSPLVFAQPVLNQIAALLTDCNHGDRVTGGYVRKGSLWNLGGAMFVANSDTVVTGVRSVATTGVKFVVSGDAATPLYGSDTVTWDGSQQGFYDSGNNFYYCGTAESGDTLLPDAYQPFADNGSNLSYHKLFSYKIPIAGYYKIVTTATGDYSATVEYCKVYINDNPIGTELSSNSETEVSQTEILFCEKNDIVQLYSHRSKDNDLYTYCSISIKTGLYGIIL